MVAYLLKECNHHHKVFELTANMLQLSNSPQQKQQNTVQLATIYSNRIILLLEPSQPCAVTRSAAQPPTGVQDVILRPSGTDEP